MCLDPFLFFTQHQYQALRTRQPPSVIIFAYVAAQAYSIYSLVPRISTRIKQVDKKPEKCGCLKEILRAVLKSKIYKLYKIYRYPFIPIGMQIFETTSQMLAFISYVSIIPTRYLAVVVVSNIDYVKICDMLLFVRRVFRVPLFAARTTHNHHMPCQVLLFNINHCVT